MDYVKCAKKIDYCTCFYGIVRRNERRSIEERDMNPGIVILTGTDVGTK